MPELTVEEIVAIATASAKAAAQELAATIAPAAAAAAPEAAAVTQATTGNNCLKKVELPSFDKNNIHTWIRRVEAAFGRAQVVLPKDKFFYIESKLDVNLNPKINEFLCGDSTEEKWDEFLEYLQNEYGRTKEQQAALFLSGIPRDGLRPTQHLAKIKDLTKDIELDDLLKEMVLKDLPKSIRQSLAERTTLTSEEAAKAADHYFDKEGRPKHGAESSSINNINEVTTANRWDTFNTTAFTEAFSDEDQAVNAIGRRFSQRPPYAQPRKTQGGGRPQQNVKNGQTIRTEKPKLAPKEVKANPNYPVKKSVDLCQAHFKFGDKARYCEVSCSRFDEQRFPGNGQAGQK